MVNSTAVCASFRGSEPEPNALRVGEITNREPSISVKVFDGLQERPDGRGARANDDPLLEQVRDSEPNLVIIAGTF